jgi:hypothetical protein
MKPVKYFEPATDNPTQANYLVSIGDYVRITTKDGKVHSFKVDSTVGNMIYGKEITIDTRDIIKVEVAEKTDIGNAGKKIGDFMLGVLAVAVILAYFVYVYDPYEDKICCGS